MKKHDAFQSKYLAKEDVGDGVRLTVSQVVMEGIRSQDNPDSLEQRPVIYWQEPNAKPLILNNINWDRIVMITGQDDTDNWAGAVIPLYNDKTVTFGNRIVGGIRVWVDQTPQFAAQAPQQQPAPPAPSAAQAFQNAAHAASPQQAPQQAPQQGTADPDDDIPW